MRFFFYLERNTDFKGQFMGRPKTHSAGAAGPAPCPLPSRWSDAIPCCVHYKDVSFRSCKGIWTQNQCAKVKKPNA